MDAKDLKDIETLALPGVMRPGRYAGGEWNSVSKDWKTADLRMALAFPDVYEVGMSNLGFLIIYHLVNSIGGALCERVFAPWPDMEAMLRKRNLPLFSLESRAPLSEFDIIGFSLGYELGFTNILTALDLGRVPLRAAQRGAQDPLVLGGGCAAFNPEPVADFFDIFLIGEAEEALPELLERYKTAKSGGAARAEILKELSTIEGIYVPSLYRPRYENGVFSGLDAEPGAPMPVMKRYIKDMDSCFYPEAPVQPSVEAVHDRANLEVFRGCARGCRYCQAGMIYRPMRERGPEKISGLARSIYASTGFEEFSLLSLNATDYSGMGPALENIDGFAYPRRISVSIPSTRLDTFSSVVGDKLRSARPTGLTFAPEAGSQRLREVINKQLSEEEIMAGLDAAFQAGWRKVKLYYMIGLPTETEADVEEIAYLTARMISAAMKLKGKNGRTAFTASVGNFVPKPHTPFQWCPMDAPDLLREKQRTLRSMINPKRVKLDTHNVEVSCLEGVFARGDRRLSGVIETAWKLGCRLDGWTEHFKGSLWREAFAERGIDPSAYSERHIPLDAPLPWGHISCGVSQEFLKGELEKALGGVQTPWCGQNGPCSACGLPCYSDLKK